MGSELVQGCLKALLKEMSNLQDAMDNYTNVSKTSKDDQLLLKKGILSEQIQKLSSAFVEQAADVKNGNKNANSNIDLKIEMGIFLYDIDSHTRSIQDNFFFRSKQRGLCYKIPQLKQSFEYYKCATRQIDSQAIDLEKLNHSLMILIKEMGDLQLFLNQGVNDLNSKDDFLFLKIGVLRKQIQKLSSSFFEQAADVKNGNQNANSNIDIEKQMEILLNDVDDYSRAINKNLHEDRLCITIRELKQALDNYNRAFDCNQYNYFLPQKRGKKSQFKQMLCARILENLMMILKLLSYLQNEDMDIRIKACFIFYFLIDQVVQEIKRLNYAQSNFKSCQLMIKQAFELFEQNDLDKALQIFNEILNKDPSNAEIYLKRSQLHFKLGDLYSSLNDANQAIQLNPNLARAYHYRGDVYQMMKKQQEAIADYSKVLELDPKYESAYLQRGQIYEEQNQQFKAVEDYSEYLKLNSRCYKILLKRANLFLEMKRFQDALEDYLKVISLDTQNSSAYIGSGLSYFNTSQFEKSIKQFSLAIQYDSNCVLAYYNLGLAYQKISNFEEALINFEKALEIHPENPLFFVDLCELYMQNKMATQALFIFKKLEEVYIGIDKQNLQKKHQLSEAEFQNIQNFIQLHKQFFSEELEQIINQDKVQANLTQNLTDIIIKLFSEVQDDRNFQKIRQFLNLINPELIINLLELVNKFNKSRERSEMIENEQKMILEEFKLLDQPDKYKFKLYYISFYSRILTCFNICIQIQENLQQFITTKATLNIDQLKEQINTIANKLLPSIGKIPTIDSVLEQMCILFDYDNDLQKNRKFLERIQNMAVIIKSKTEDQSERQKEIQRATLQIIIELLDQSNQDVLNKIKSSQFQKKVHQIVDLEVRLKEEAKEPFWQLGIENSMVVITYLLTNEQQKLKNQSIKLTRIIIDSLQKQERTSCSCCLV